MIVRTITLHGAHNYGAMLQAFALKRTLEDMGHDSGVINYLPGIVNELNNKLRISKNPRQLIRAIIGLKDYSKWKRRFKKFEDFKESFMNLTDHYEDLDELRASPPVSDAYLCGSDQIWNPERSFKEQFFLRFGDEGVKRISYAASFGVSHVPEERHANLCEYLKKFDTITMREESGAQAVESITGLDAEVVVDPTLLLSESEWSEMIPSERVVEGSYMLVYCLEESPLFLAAVEEFAAHTSLPVVVIAGSVINRFKEVSKVLIDIGPQEFLRLFLDAELIVTNSFHGTAFGLNFSRPLVSVEHRTRNDRMSTILEAVGWPDSQCSKLGEVEELMKIAQTRATPEVAAKLVSKREASKDILSRALS